jgi:integrase
MSNKRKSETFAGFKIRYRKDRDRYFIQIRRDGIKHAQSFATIEAARLKCQQLHNEQVNKGLVAFEMDGKSREDANAAMKLLNGRCTLEDAARLWLRHNPDGAAVTVQNVADLYLADMGRRKIRKGTIADCKYRLLKFAKDYGDRPAVTITPEMIAEWLTIRCKSAVNSNNSRKWLFGMFSFAVRRRILEINPVAAVDTSPVDAKLPEHWDAEKVEAIMRAAQTFKPDMVPLLAIMAFAGLRPDEAAQLNWKDVKLNDGIIRILPGTSKVRQARIVEISDNLTSWLMPNRRKAGPVAPAKMTITRWRRRIAAAAVLGIDQVRGRLDQHKGKKGTEIKKAKLGWSDITKAAKKKGKLWPNDILRHSMATAWLAKHNDIYKLAEMLGNSPAVIKRHYRGLMTASEAEDYWNITPESKGGIIEFRRSA